MPLGGLGCGTLEVFPDGTRGRFTGLNNWEQPVEQLHPFRPGTAADFRCANPFGVFVAWQEATPYPQYSIYLRANVLVPPLPPPQSPALALEDNSRSTCGAGSGPGPAAAWILGAFLLLGLLRR